MKPKIIIILVVVILIALSVLAVKKHIDNSVVDKYGMVKTPEDDIILCRYSSGGGMDGSSESLEIRKSENGGTVITYDYTSLTSDKDISKSVEAPFTPVGAAGHKQAHPDTGTIGNVTVFDSCVIHFFSPSFENQRKVMGHSIPAVRTIRKYRTARPGYTPKRDSRGARRPSFTARTTPMPRTTFRI